MFKQPLILPSVGLHSSAFTVLHVYEPKLYIKLVAVAGFYFKVFALHSV